MGKRSGMTPKKKQTAFFEEAERQPWKTLCYSTAVTSYAFLQLFHSEQ
ncbi:hypothetical protein A21D_02189 [Virgibacillus dokdonensis]|uniref:Uncharacterized protein n=1 Tax=Virgibacillus dokdonensis TaxID=302167 RepID=A0A2K9J2J3_9BACI|nr:hypothetical protein A21D_02189 [Virgibacillus dokdonensis]